MKIKIGGSVSYRIQLANFEPAEISASIEIEDEVPENGVETLQNKVNEMLQKQANKRMEMTILNFKEKRGHWKEMLQ